jgi:hypothetical protein
MRGRVMAAIAATLMFGQIAFAHEDTDDEGGKTAFDPWCCNHEDCKRVKDSDLLTIASGAIIHVPTGAIFKRDNFRMSTNKHQYVCIPRGEPRCVYLRAGT